MYSTVQSHPPRFTSMRCGVNVYHAAVNQSDGLVFWFEKYWKQITFCKYLITYNNNNIIINNNNNIKNNNNKMNLSFVSLFTLLGSCWAVGQSHSVNSLCPRNQGFCGGCVSGAGLTLTLYTDTDPNPDPNPHPIHWYRP